jgi:hypothetical protein
MKTQRGKRTLTFGDLIGNGCRACGKGRATGLILLAAKARLIGFQEQAHEPGHERCRTVPIQFI